MIAVIDIAPVCGMHAYFNTLTDMGPKVMFESHSHCLNQRDGIFPS